MTIATLTTTKDEQTGVSEFVVTVAGQARHLDEEGAVQVAIAIDSAVSGALGEQSRDVEREVREAVVANHRVKVSDVQERIAALEAELEAALAQADAAEAALADVTGETAPAPTKPSSRGRKSQRAQLAVVKDDPAEQVSEPVEEPVTEPVAQAQAADVEPVEEPPYEEEPVATFGGAEYRDDEF